MVFTLFALPCKHVGGVFCASSWAFGGGGWSFGGVLGGFGGVLGGFGGFWGVLGGFGGFWGVFWGLGSKHREPPSSALETYLNAQKVMGDALKPTPNETSMFWGLLELSLPDLGEKGTATPTQERPWGSIPFTHLYGCVTSQRGRGCCVHGDNMKRSKSRRSP